MSTWKINLKERTATSINGITFKLTEVEPDVFRWICTNPKDIPPDDLDHEILEKMVKEAQAMYKWELMKWKGQPLIFIADSWVIDTASQEANFLPYYHNSDYSSDTPVYSYGTAVYSYGTAAHFSGPPSDYSTGPSAVGYLIAKGITLY